MIKLSETKLVSKQEKVEYENLNIKIPKQFAEFLKWKATIKKCSLEEQAEEHLFDSVRAELEGMDGEDVIDIFGAGPVIFELFGDKRFAKTIG